MAGRIVSIRPRVAHGGDKDWLFRKLLVPWDFSMWHEKYEGRALHGWLKSSFSCVRCSTAVLIVFGWPVPRLCGGTTKYMLKIKTTSRRRPTLLATTIDSRTCFFMIFIGCPLKKQEGWHDGIFGSCNKMLPWKISIGVRSFQKALQISINIIWWHKSFMFTCHKPTSQRNVLIMFSFSSNVVP